MELIKTVISYIFIVIFFYLLTIIVDQWKIDKIEIVTSIACAVCWIATLLAPHNTYQRESLRKGSYVMTVVWVLSIFVAIVQNNLGFH